MADFTLNAELVSRVDINDELSVFKVRPIGWELPEYESGQYAEIAIPQHAADGEKIERRSYSIASSPSAKELEFYIVRVENGYLTPKLWQLKPGDQLWLGQKIKGKFVIEDVHRGKDLFMVATGTGLAPFISMLRNFKDNPPWRRAAVIHGARFQRDLGYCDELRELASLNKNIFYIPSLTREPSDSGWQGLSGRIPALFSKGTIEEITREQFSLEHSHFLLCGNPQMIDDMQSTLEARGFALHKKKAPGNIHVERYW